MARKIIEGPEYLMILEYFEIFFANCGEQDITMVANRDFIVGKAQGGDGHPWVARNSP